MESIAILSALTTIVVFLQVSLVYLAGMVHEKEKGPHPIIAPGLGLTFFAICLLLHLGGVLW